MRQRALMGCAAAVLAGLAAACVTVAGPAAAPPPGQPSEYRKTVEFMEAGTVAVEHTLGNIAISGWDRDSVEIVAKVRKADPGGRRQVHLYAGEELEPAIDVRLGEDILRVRTKSLGGPWTTTAMDYAIRVPSSVSLRAIRLERGNLSVSDVSGRLEAAVGSGDLTVRNYSGFLKANLSQGSADVELLNVRGEDAVEVVSLQGDIVLRLRPGASVHLMAEAPKGEISSDFDLGVTPPIRSLTAKLGSGAAPVSLKALRGNIRILKTQ